MSIEQWKYGCLNYFFGLQKSFKYVIIYLYKKRKGDVLIARTKGIL